MYASACECECEICVCCSCFFSCVRFPYHSLYRCVKIYNSSNSWNVWIYNLPKEWLTSQQFTRICEKYKHIETRTQNHTQQIYNFTEVKEKKKQTNKQNLSERKRKSKCLHIGFPYEVGNYVWNKCSGVLNRQPSKKRNFFAVFC